MGDSTKHGVKRKKKKKKKAAREATRGAGGRADGLRRSLAPPVGFLPSSTCPLRSHSAPGKFRRCPSTSKRHLWPSPGMRGPIFNFAVDLFAQPARCWLQPWVALHVREPESRWVALAKWQVGPVFRPLFICGYTSAYCETISGETLPRENIR